MNNKGFTFIELLATITILALILLLVIPSLTALVNNNENKIYESYGDSLLEASKIYVNNEGEDINPQGIKNWLGCVDITYEDLINSDLIKPFPEENVDCSDAKVRYTKSKDGNSFSYDLTCKDVTNNEILYEYHGIGGETCKVIDADDVTPPVCGEVTGDSTEWTNEAREITISCTDESGCEPVTKVFDSTTQVGYITVEDNNGNKTSCPVNAYVDKTPPVCSNSGGSSNWTKDDVTISGTCTDYESGCQTPSVSKLYNKEGEFLNQSPGKLTDNVGNTTTCPTNQTVRIDRSVATPYIVELTNERAPMVCNYTTAQMKAGVYAPIKCTLYAYDPPTGFTQRFSADDKGGSGIKDEISYFQGYGSSSCRDPGNAGTFPWGQWNTNALGNYGISHCTYAEYFVRQRDNAGNISEPLTLYIYYGN